MFNVVYYGMEYVYNGIVHIATQKKIVHYIYH